MAVSLARAYAIGGITQIARFRQPGAAASRFMLTLVATDATFSTRARIARLPCSASAMPSAAKTSAAASGMPASSAAAHWMPLAANTILNWASKLTAAAAAASRPSASMAYRSQVADRSPALRGLRSERLIHFTPLCSSDGSYWSFGMPKGSQEFVAMRLMLSRT